MRGHYLGRAIYDGSAQPNTNIPGLIGGYAGERVLRAPADGIFRGVRRIGDHVSCGDVAGYVGDVPMACTIGGTLRGLLADGIAVWGGDGAVAAIRKLAPPGCKLIEWGHRLSFAYLSNWEGLDLAPLAGHILRTGGLLCSSCQVVYLDTGHLSVAERFCKQFLPVLEKAAASHYKTPGQAAQAALYAREAALEQIVDRARFDDLAFPGQLCSLTLRRDMELELSHLHGNVLVKRLPRQDLVPVLRRQRGRLQTAGLLCPGSERKALAALLARAGVNRITAPGHMSDALPLEAHDGEYPLRRYVRVVDVEEPQGRPSAAPAQIF